MAITWDKALGIHPHALLLRAQRAEILASNLANANTPNYKAQDVDFKSVLQSIRHNKPAPGMPNQLNGFQSQVEKMYRIPNQDSLDGNTVDANAEHMEFMKNSNQYQASFQFLNGRIKGLMMAIKGN